MSSVLRKKSATQYHNLGQHHIYRRITWDTVGVQDATGGKCYIGGIPAFALPEEVICRIRTTFDGDLTIGTSADTDAYATSTDIDSNTTGTYVTNRPYGGYTTTDLPIYAVLTTASTVGSADVWVTFRQAEISTD
jgi:hypothetical protein